MAMNVGTSARTWLKHRAMQSFVEKEVRALSRPKFGWVPASDWFDLTAGNGQAVDIFGDYVEDAETGFWIKHCSPGILSGQAKVSHKPVTIHMYENDAETYRTLVQQLDRHLDVLDFDPDSDTADEAAWRGESEHGQPIHVVAFYGSGHTATIDHVGKKHFVLGFNDGNAVTQWAVSATFSSDIMETTRHLRMFHAIGANANGVKRGKDAEFRSQWFDYVEVERAALTHDHDLLLCRLVNDSHQWAYMKRTPTVFVPQEAGQFRAAFKDWRGGIEMASYRNESENFNRLIHKLFSTNSEYQYAGLVGENLCLF